MTEILVVTKNPNKLKEIIDIFGDERFQLKTLLDYPPIDIVESGSSFFENAYIKAKEASKKFNVISMGEDSGLVITALNGQPGIYSKRFAGEHATDLDNNLKLMQMIKDVPEHSRDAKFVSCVVIMKPNGKYIYAEGYLYGIIIDEMRGQGGFGYDPLFYIPEYGKTLAELGDEIKNKISHRYRALKSIKEKLNQFLEDD
jgi:XTP/dITP diphosphohydrolase